MNILSKVYRFYAEGFRNMTVGRTLWIIILIKLFVFFVLLRLIFFPDFLNSRFSGPEEKSNYVTDQLTNQPK